MVALGSVARTLTTQSIVADSNSSLAVGLNLANTFGGLSGLPSLPAPPGTAGFWGTGGIVEPVVSLLFPQAGGAATAAEVRTAQYHVAHEDPAKKFRVSNPAIVTALGRSGIQADVMSPWQMMDALQQRIAEIAARLPKPPDSKIREALSKIVAGTGLEYWFGNGALIPLPLPTPQHRFGIRPLGVADLRVVRQVLLRYEKGEVAHIENVLAGEERERTHRRLQRTEETFYSVTEKETENSRDAQSTDRYEVSREARQASREQVDLSAGVKVTASYGAVSVETTADFATQRSAEQSSSSAQKESRELVNRAVEKVRERVQEERTRKVLAEVEETAVHRQKADGPANIVGLYRWVDKVYRAQVFNYGKRAMYELLVPEPASLFKRLMTRRNDTSGLVGEQPVKPNLTAESIDEYSWMKIAQEHRVSLPPPPASTMVEFATVAWPTKDNDKPVVVGSFNSSEATEKGFKPSWCTCSMTWYGVEGKCGLAVSIGAHLFEAVGGGTSPILILNDVASALTYNVRGYGAVHQYSVNLWLNWERTKVALQEWQLNCFNIIMEDYDRRLGEYKERVTAARIGNGQFDTELTDSQMRAIERNELKRAILEVVRTGQPPLAPVMSDSADGLPSINAQSLEDASEEIRFFENAFEWEQMTYKFHPYYWVTNREQWDAGLFRPKGDAIFTAFLSAGAASVALPVRNEYVNAVAVYFQTGRIVNAPIVPADKLLMQMNAEVLARSESVDDGIPEGDAWTYRIPTSLVILEESTAPKLPNFSETVGRPVHPFIPGTKLCETKKYNAADWPNEAPVLVEMRKLGYPFEYGDAKSLLESERGKALVRAFQEFCNDEGISKRVNDNNLMVDGLVGPCTLRVLSASKVLRQAGEWTGPSK